MDSISLLSRETNRASNNKKHHKYLQEDWKMNTNIKNSKINRGFPYWELNPGLRNIIYPIFKCLRYTKHGVRIRNVDHYTIWNYLIDGEVF